MSFIFSNGSGDCVCFALEVERSGGWDFHGVVMWIEQRERERGEEGGEKKVKGKRPNQIIADSSASKESRSVPSQERWGAERINIPKTKQSLNEEESTEQTTNVKNED